MTETSVFIKTLIYSYLHPKGNKSNTFDILFLKSPFVYFFTNSNQNIDNTKQNLEYCY